MNGVGLGAFDGRARIGDSAYDVVGSAWSRERQAEHGVHTKELAARLLEFAASHGRELCGDAAFAARFVEALNLAGLDPMAVAIESERGDEDFLNRLGVRVIEACTKSQGWNGGLLPVAHVTEQLNAAAAGAARRVTASDVVAAVEAQAALGPGIELVALPNGQLVVQTSTHELSSEQGDVLAACDALGYVTVAMLVDNFGWARERCERLLEQMVSAGLLWIDAQATPTSYWTPGVL